VNKRKKGSNNASRQALDMRTKVLAKFPIKVVNKRTKILPVIHHKCVNKGSKFLEELHH